MEDGQKEKGFGLEYQMLGGICDFSHRECFIEIRMHVFIIDGNVEIDNVAFLQRAVIRDSMANHFIDRRANGLWELPVVQRGGIGSFFDDELMDGLVYRLSCDSRLDH